MVLNFRGSVGSFSGDVYVLGSKLGSCFPMVGDGLPRRPILMRTNETMLQVRKYLANLKGISKLDEPFCEFTSDPIIPFLDYEEFDPRHRFNKAEVLRRFNKRRGGVEDVNS